MHKLHGQWAYRSPSFNYTFHSQSSLIWYHHKRLLLYFSSLSTLLEVCFLVSFSTLHSIHYHLCYKALNNSAQSYLSQCLTLYHPSRQLRSSEDKILLCIPRELTAIGRKNLNIAAVYAWNELPRNIRLAPSTVFVPIPAHAPIITQQRHFQFTICATINRPLKSSHLVAFRSRAEPSIEYRKPPIDARC